MIGPLTDPRAHGADPADAFHLVIPSIPGFGFSGPTRERGWDIVRVAGAWAELMRRLGYDRYGAQGGDCGLVRLPGTRPRSTPSTSSACTSTSCRPIPPAIRRRPRSRQPRRQGPARPQRANPGRRVRLLAIQATRPQTLGLRADRLAGRPAGLDRREVPGMDRPAPADPRTQSTATAMLTNVMLYWLTDTAASSARFYYEVTHSDRSPPAAVTHPAGRGGLPVRRPAHPRSRRTRRPTSCSWTEFDWAATSPPWNSPQLLVGDIRAFFRELPH